MNDDVLENFQNAERMLQDESFEESLEIYASLLESPIASLAHYRLGAIHNHLKNVEQSIFHHQRAFELDPLLAAKLVGDDHPFHNYSYKVDNQLEILECPLCGGQSSQHSCYNSVLSPGFVEGFDPIRVWRYCESCHHIFAQNYPENIGDALSRSTPQHLRSPQPTLIPLVSAIVRRIQSYQNGKHWLEVGPGTGEMIAVAKEFGNDVTGIEIRPALAKAVAQTFNVEVKIDDYLQYDPTEKYDVICMGDVLEHMTDPTRSIKKTYQLLHKGGVLWISTPNFDSAFSMMASDKDPMWLIVQHINYFSHKSLKKLLESNGFRLADYNVSSRYNGSMEVIAVKV